MVREIGRQVQGSASLAQEAVGEAEVKGSWPRRPPKATDQITGQIARIPGATGQAVTASEGIRRRIEEVSSVSTSIAAEEQGAATQEIVHNVARRPPARARRGVTSRGWRRPPRGRAPRPPKG